MLRPKTSSNYVQEANQDRSQSPSKPAPKKRARAKKDDGDDTADEGSAPKKPKAATRKGGKKKLEGENGEPGTGTPPPTKAKGRKKAVTKVEQEDGEAGTDTPPPKKAKARKKVVPKAQQEDRDSLDGTPLPEKVKGRKKNVVKAGDDVKNIKGEGAENDMALESIPRRARAPRKATLGNKVKDEASETEDEDGAFEPTGAPTKSKAGDKKTVANGTVQAVKSQRNKKEAATAEVCF